MTLKLNGTNSVAAPAYAGDDADTGLQCGTNELKLVTGGTARATVDSSGRVGINTTTFSDTATALVIKNGASASEHTMLDIVCDTNESARVRFSEDGSTFPGEIRYNTFNHALLFTVNSSERMRILSGGGITFNGDTAAANALHDYEEGTFTPRLVIENVGNVTIYTNKKGSYVKVGSTVTVWFNMTVDGTPSGRSTSNAIEFHDLPFTSTDDDNDGAAYYIGSIGDFSEAIIRLNNNNTMGRIECREASTSQLRNSSLWLKDNTTIHATITYRTDS